MEKLTSEEIVGRLSDLDVLDILAWKFIFGKVLSQKKISVPPTFGREAWLPKAPHLYN